MNAKRRIGLLLTTLGLGVALLGCGPVNHMRPDHGKISHAYFRQQQVFQTGAADQPKGLDSEEASLVNASYRKQISGGTAAQQESANSPSRVLLLQESKEQPK